MEPENGLLDKYLLNLAMVEKPKICFMGTASNDGKEYIDLFYKFFREKNCIPTHLPLFETTKTTKEIEKIILEQDIIHVGGGNTKLIMETWKKHGVDKIMKKAWQRGVILSGMSAGAICWFEDGITNPNPGELSRLECVGLLKGSFCPHYDDRPELREVFKKLIMEKVIHEGYGVDDGAALHFVDTKLLRVVSSRPDKTAFKVKKVKEKLFEEKLESIFLGRDSDLKSVNTDKIRFETVKTIYEFIEAINTHDAKKIIEMLTDEHLFVDSMGSVATGKDTLLKAWKGYFDWFPDYKITLEHTYIEDNSIALFGKASGTFDVNGKLLRENSFEMPTAWRAEVTDNKISLWQVYADNHPVWQIIERNEREPDGEILTKIKLLSAIEH